MCLSPRVRVDKLCDTTPPPTRHRSTSPHLFGVRRRVVALGEGFRRGRQNRVPSPVSGFADTRMDTAITRVTHASIPFGFRYTLSSAALLNVFVGVAWGLMSLDRVSWWWVKELLLYSAIACAAQWVAMVPLLWLGSLTESRLSKTAWGTCCWAAWWVAIMPIPLGMEYSPPVLPIVFMIVWWPCVCACLITSWFAHRS